MRMTDVASELNCTDAYDRVGWGITAVGHSRHVGDERGLRDPLCAGKYRPSAWRRGPVNTVLVTEHAMLIYVRNPLTTEVIFIESGSDRYHRRNPVRAKRPTADLPLRVRVRPHLSRLPPETSISSLQTRVSPSLFTRGALGRYALVPELRKL